MSHSRLNRLGLSVVAAGTAAILGASPAMAHHCYIPMYSLNGPSSPNWVAYSAQDGAAEFAGYTAECQGAVDAGYAALRANKMPVGIKIMEEFTIGDPNETGRMNPNGANGKGLEYFGAGSRLADEMLTVWIAASDMYPCP